ncbi:hypothetical protein HDU99_003445, partial [Rhizoclosmatium hyalinum]
MHCLSFICVLLSLAVTLSAALPSRRVRVRRNSSVKLVKKDTPPLFPCTNLNEYGCDTTNHLFQCLANPDDASGSLVWLLTGDDCSLFNTNGDNAKSEDTPAPQPKPQEESDLIEGVQAAAVEAAPATTPATPANAPQPQAEPQSKTQTQGDTTKRCGTSWTDANNKCGTLCTYKDIDCPSGEKCFRDLKADVCVANSLKSDPATTTAPAEADDLIQGVQAAVADIATVPAPVSQPQTTAVVQGDNSKRCGSSWSNANAKCGSICSDDNGCAKGEKCFKDLAVDVCSANSQAPAPAPQPEASDTASSGSTSTSFSSLISETDFNNALSACGMSKPSLYSSFVKGFKAPLLGGYKELALLLGNTAHESGGFHFLEEIQCKGVGQVTQDCPYGWYHGRGYIQLSWDFNYRDAGNALGLDLLGNPDLIRDDETVNVAVVQWYWMTTVQPYLKTNGYTFGNSVLKINGPVECGVKPISSGRI